MPVVTYQGSTDKSVHDASAVEIDGIRLEKDKPATLTDEQIERLPAHHRFSFGEAEQLKGDALDDRVRELGIEGASTMTADEKRAAVADAEAAQGGDS